MKTVVTFIGLILIVIGISALAYQGFTYTKREKIVQVGNLEVTADTEKKVYLSPILGGLALVGGIVLVVVGRRGK